MLYDILSFNYVPIVVNIIRSLAAIDNAYMSPLWTDKDSDFDDIDSLLHRNTPNNDLMELKNGWTSSSLQTLQSRLPRLTEDDLRTYSIGPYVLRLITPYLEHTNNLTYWIRKKKDEKNLFKVSGLTSRFSASDACSPKNYTVILDIPPDGDVKKIRTYCTCKTGARTLGGCVHAATILSHLCIGSCNQQMRTPNAKSKANLLTDNDVRQFKRQKIASLSVVAPSAPVGSQGTA